MGETLELHAGGSLITLYFRQQSVDTHARKHRPGIITEPAHRPLRQRQDLSRLCPGSNACLQGYSVRTYHHLSRLLLELTQAKADGSYPKQLKRMAKVQ